MAALTAVGIGLAVASTISSVVQQRKAANAATAQGLAQQKAAESQAQVLDFNANVADLQAKDAVERGAEAESRFRSTIRGAIGSQRAGFAAANIDVSFGSAVDVQADAAFLGELDALTIRTNAAREAWGYQVQAADIRKRADVARREGVMMAEAGRVNASTMNWQIGSTILGGASSLLQFKYGMEGK
jgi:hypothetical protein